jgi:aspartate racemase
VVEFIFGRSEVRASPDSVPPKRRVRVDSKGRVSIPSDIRRSLGLSRGSEVLLGFDLANSRIVLTLAGKSEGWTSQAGRLDFRRKLSEGYGQGGVIKSIGDCGSPGPGGKPLDSRRESSGVSPGPGPVNRYKRIGILGGMGPESTAALYQELIRQCQKQYGAQYDEDYPEIFICSIPIPDIVKGLENPQGVLPVLVSGAKKLESIGADFMIMPCNTAEYFYENMKKEVSIPFLSIIEETAKKIESSGYRKVGLLATETTIVKRIYNRILDCAGIELIVPEEQDEVTAIILNIISGKKLNKDKDALKAIIKNLEKRGAEAIILGCTDIPVLLKQKDVETKLFDSIEILAESAIKYAIGPRIDR